MSPLPFGAKATNDTLRLTRIGGVVRAYKNSVLKYAWATTNSGTLYFGGTFVNTSSGIHDIKMGNIIDSDDAPVDPVWEMLTLVTRTETDLATLDAPIYANNAAAKTGGLTYGKQYRTGGDPDLLCVVH